MKRVKGLIALLIVCTFCFTPVYGTEIETEGNIENDAHYEENVMRCDGKGYTEPRPLDDNDIHLNINMGRFVIKGFSEKERDINGNLIFYRNGNDKIVLYYELFEDINNLNNDENLRIYNQKKGSDKMFEMTDTYFGKGFLGVKFTNPQNDARIASYTNYLKGVNAGANTEMIPIQEGDYVVALDYTIQKKEFLLFSLKYSYKLKIKFSVRDSSARVFVKDKENNMELNDGDKTSSGFYLDYAKKQYLITTIDRRAKNSKGKWITKEKRIAREGEPFTKKGKYIITAKNESSKLKTVTSIYVVDKK